MVPRRDHRALYGSLMALLCLTFCVTAYVALRYGVLRDGIECCMAVDGNATDTTPDCLAEMKQTYISTFARATGTFTRTIADVVFLILTWGAWLLHVGVFPSLHWRVPIGVVVAGVLVCLLMGFLELDSIVKDFSDNNHTFICSSVARDSIEWAKLLAVSMGIVYFFCTLGFVLHLTASRTPKYTALFQAAPILPLSRLSQKARRRNDSL